MSGVEKGVLNIMDGLFSKIVLLRMFYLIVEKDIDIF